MTEKEISAKIIAWQVLMYKTIKKSENIVSNFLVVKIHWLMPEKAWFFI